jgi:hypothetical protein
MWDLECFILHALQFGQGFSKSEQSIPTLEQKRLDEKLETF